MSANTNEPQSGSADLDVPLATPAPSRLEDAAALKAAAQTIEADLPRKKRLLPTNRMTRSDTSMSHLLTEGELSRVENASKFGGWAGGAALVYGSTFGIAQPFIAALIHWYRSGRDQLGDGEVVTLIIGLLLIGAAIREWWKGSTTETVSKICAEYRRRPQSDLE